MACLLLGLWLGAGLWMQFVAADNSSAADSLLLRPTAAASEYLKSLGHTPISPLARYLAAEQNRSLYETWGMVQIAMAAFFFFFLLFGTRQGKVPLALGLLMFLIAVGERVAVTPEMEAVGRVTDFAASQSHRVRVANEVLSYGYTLAEVAKWVLAAGVAGILIWPRGGRSTDSRHQVDMVDKANHRHIDW
jgi:hypothetical protein